MAKGLWLLVFVLGCAATTSQPTTLPAPPPTGTQAALVGPRCQGSSCQCRDPDVEAAEEAPPAGLKRYEVRLGPADNELWATIDDNRLYKGRERATECFYVDLPAGEHTVSLRAHRVGGFSARVIIKEQSAGGPWWYDTFELDCSGTCSDGALRAWKESLSRFRNHIHDPCGSTKVQQVEWATARQPDSLQPDDLAVDLVLNVYRFPTSLKPGSAECVKTH